MCDTIVTASNRISCRDLHFVLARLGVLADAVDNVHNPQAVPCHDLRMHEFSADVSHHDCPRRYDLLDFLVFLIIVSINAILLAVLFRLGLKSSTSIVGRHGVFGVLC